MKIISNSVAFILVLILVSACTNDSSKNFTLKGNIKGLKKGVVYLQKEKDSTVVTLDSIVINGNPNFTLSTNLEEPILLYLRLNKKDNAEHYIPFFADKGVTEITTSLKHFNYDAKIKGSKQQQLLEDYLKVIYQYNTTNLELIKASFLAQKDNNTRLIDSINLKSQQLLKRKYSYTIQYALNNKNSEVAPYITFYEIPNANPIYLDSIYNGLTPEIKNSVYGKKLANAIKNRPISE